MTTEIVKYDRPLSAPLQTPENARLMLLAHQADLGHHIAKAAGVDIGQVVSTAVSAIATAEPRLQAALLACTGQSVLKSVADAARYGLVFGSVFGQAYLVPFKNQCTLIVGYRGLEALVYRAGIRAVQSGIVYEGDEYDVEIGRQPPIRHKPNPNADHKADKIIAAYAMAWVSPELAIGETMNRQDLDHIRSKSKAGATGPYATDTAEMFRKAPIRRLCKHLPLSPSDRAMLDEILAREDEREGMRVSPADAVIEGEARAKEILGGEETPEPAAEVDPLVSVRKHIGELAEARATRIQGNGGAVLAHATREALGDTVGLGELSVDQAILVREFLEGQEGGAVP